MGTEHVFSSYCHHDREVVTQLGDDLVRAGVSVWWDGDLVAGEDRLFEIRQRRRNLGNSERIPIAPIRFQNVRKVESVMDHLAERAWARASLQSCLPIAATDWQRQRGLKAETASVRPSGDAIHWPLGKHDIDKPKRQVTDKPILFK
jgi:hypothetical protein